MKDARFPAEREAIEARKAIAVTQEMDAARKKTAEQEKRRREEAGRAREAAAEQEQKLADLAVDNRVATLELEGKAFEAAQARMQRAHEKRLAAAGGVKRSARRWKRR